MQKKTTCLLALLWVLVIGGICAATAMLLLNGGSDRQWVSASEYEMLQRYARLEEVRQTVEDSYYLEVDDEALMQGAIDGMLAALDDPYTRYFTNDEMAKLSAETEGEYHGIGVILQSNADGYIQVLRVFEASPAKAAGILPDDLIVSVDGAQVHGADSEAFSQALEMMQGEDGSTVALGLLRGTETVMCDVVRGSVYIENVHAHMLEDGIGYVEIVEFNGNAVDEFKEAIEFLKNEHAKGVVIDLRNNPGGLLTHVVDMMDLVLPEGLTVYMQNRAGVREDFYSDAACFDLPMVVLINENSASASEIFAAAMQDYGRAVVVGTRSFGKGLVQTLITFDSDGAGMQYTEATYFTPSGRNIHGVGVEPDVLSADDSGYLPGAATPDAANDLQLIDAVTCLLGQIENAAN